MAVEPWRYVSDEWSVWFVHDFGSAAPSVTYVLSKSPKDTGADGRWYACGNIVAIDELATNRSNDRLNEGIGWTVPVVLADAIKAMCARWKIGPHGVADDAIFAKTGSGAGCIADEFVREGIYFDPAQKGDRVSGWQRMRRLLSGAGKPDRPGLYVSQACCYWWLTAPYAGRDIKRPPGGRGQRGADHR